MGNDDRKAFFRVLSRILGPELRAQGFAGSGTTYRRLIDPAIHVVNIQGSRYGGECCVNLGVHLRFLPTSLGDLVDPKRISEPNCEFRTRLADHGESDHWWPYGDTECEAERSAEDVLEMFGRRGAPYFAKWSDFPGRFIDLTVADVARGETSKLPGHLLELRAALAMARIHLHMQNREMAREFALFGLSSLGRATGLKHAFDEILSCTTDGDSAAGGLHR
jgi:hypothetical protein